MQVISYVSQCTIPALGRGPMIDGLVQHARQRNEELGVTGVLFFENDFFFQTIEGPNDHLQSLFHEIANDNRHRDVVTLLNEPADHRSFEGWSLDSFKIDHPELINPGIINKLMSIYASFGMSADGMVNFIRHMIDEIDTYKLMDNIQSTRRS